MATKNQAAPQVDPEITPTVTPIEAEVAPVEIAAGPTIEYLGEGAELVEFTINPKATSYVVRGDGLIIENL